VNVSSGWIKPGNGAASGRVTRLCCIVHFFFRLRRLFFFTAVLPTVTLSALLIMACHVSLFILYEWSCERKSITLTLEN